MLREDHKLIHLYGMLFTSRSRQTERETIKKQLNDNELATFDLDFIQNQRR